MSVRFVSDPYMNNDGFDFKPRYSSRRPAAPAKPIIATIDNVLDMKCLTFAAAPDGKRQFSYGIIPSVNADAADILCMNPYKYERFQNELKKLCAASPIGSGYIRYIDTGISYAELHSRINELKSIGLLKNAIFSPDCVYITIEPTAVGFITKDAAVLHSTNELRRKGAFDIRYDCMLKDKNSGITMNIDIIYQREQGGHIEFVDIVLNSRLTELSNPNMEKHYRKIVETADRLKGLTLIVSPSIDTEALRAILMMYTRNPIKILKMNELSYLR